MGLVGAVALAALLGGCSAGAPGSLHYAGPAPGCGRNEGGGVTATLARSESFFAFAPYDGSLVVDGRVAADGTMSGTIVLHPASAGSGTATPARPAQVLTASGRITPDSAIVTYTAPGCSATVTLARVRPPLL